MWTDEIVQHQLTNLLSDKIKTLREQWLWGSNPQVKDENIFNALVVKMIVKMINVFWRYLKSNHGNPKFYSLLPFVSTNGGIMLTNLIAYSYFNKYVIIFAWVKRIKNRMFTILISYHMNIRISEISKFGQFSAYLSITL